MSVWPVLAQGANGGGLPGSWFGMMAVIFLIWWVLLIRPQRQQEKRHREMLASLKAGDKVVTTGGIFGSVQQVTDKTVKLKIADNVRIEVQRSAIGGAQPTSSDGDKTS